MSQNSLFEKSEGKMLTFMLGAQEYGIKILEAREVVGLMPIDPVPHTPPFMKGVINLRGKIIPVIDLRAKFNMSPMEETTTETCIIVVDVQGALTGLVVDALVGVTRVEAEQFEDTPQLGTNIRTEFISGMAKLDTRVVIVLDIENILTNDELVLLKSQGAL
ncbi:MAG: chemotaxis protein CheW [bacterium]